MTLGAAPAAVSRDGCHLINVCVEGLDVGLEVHRLGLVPDVEVKRLHHIDARDAACRAQRMSLSSAPCCWIEHACIA